MIDVKVLGGIPTDIKRLEQIAKEYNYPYNKTRISSNGRNLFANRSTFVNGSVLVLAKNNCPLIEIKEKLYDGKIYHNLYVKEGYEIHHINGFKKDDRIENLIVLSKEKHELADKKLCLFRMNRITEEEYINFLSSFYEEKIKEIEFGDLHIKLDLLTDLIVDDSFKRGITDVEEIAEKIMFICGARVVSTKEKTDEIYLNLPTIYAVAVSRGISFESSLSSTIQHEFMHRVLDREQDEKTCNQWDNIYHSWIKPWWTE